MSTQAVLSYSHTVGMYAAAGRGFRNAVDLALGNGGSIYVLMRGPELVEGRQRLVTVLTVDEDFLGQFCAAGDDDGMLRWPMCIAVDKDEKVYITDDALDRISIFTKDGQFLGKWGTKGTGDGQFDGPAGITIDRDDNLLVVDSQNNRIQRYTKDGRFLGAWGREGSSDGEFNLPWGISVDQAGDVYVADWRNDRIQKFNAAGKHLATLGTSGEGDGQFRRPSSIAVDKDGDIYVTDWGNERLQVLSADGGFHGEFRGEATNSKWAEDYFGGAPEERELREASDLEPELDLLPDEDYLRNESASIEKLFWGPVSVKVDSQGRVFVLETSRHRVQIYQKT